MATQRRLDRPWSRFLTVLLCGSGAAVAIAACGFSGPAASSGTGGTTGTAGNSTTPGAGTSTTGTSGNNPGVGGSGTPTGGSGSTGGVNPGAGSGTGGGSVGGSSTSKFPTDAPNYELSGTWPDAPIAFATKPGQLKYTRQVIHSTFLAESCSIADYNGDGDPDVSAGRIWYQGPAFTASHPFRDGHGVLPARAKAPKSTPAFPTIGRISRSIMDHDGDTDIINIAQCDVDENRQDRQQGRHGPEARDRLLVREPGQGQASGRSELDPALDQLGRAPRAARLDRLQPRRLPGNLRRVQGLQSAHDQGLLSGDPANPTAAWTFKSVTVPFTFPFGGLGWMHGEGGGDVNGDGLPICSSALAPGCSKRTARSTKRPARARTSPTSAAS